MIDKSGARPTLLVTGSSGFVGTALVDRLQREERFHVRAAVRRPVPAADGADQVIVTDLDRNPDWSAAVADVDTVIHLAARVHVMRDTAADAVSEFRNVNTTGTEVLARAAARSGARRFIYLSSIKVNGEQTNIGRPFTERDPPAPLDAYAVSKHEAEIALRSIAAETGMEVVVIRAPLVYGPGVKANFHRMMEWLSRRIPLPFGSIQNSRTLISLENLIDLVVACVSNPNAANETFLAGDGDDVSTPQLLTRLGLALGSEARLIPMPPAFLRFGLRMLGQGEAALRLCGSLQADISHARDVLNWTPPLTLDEGLRRVAVDFLRSR